jgi:tRNA(Ile)-lysidine synthase
MTFKPEALFKNLQQHAQPNTLWVGFSGGLDSTVLLHALNALYDNVIPAQAGIHNDDSIESGNTQLQIKAIHIHHGLSPNADAWTKHCAQLCQTLNIPLQVVRVDAKPKPGESPEAAAREARYSAFKQIIEEGDWLLTGHHQDDQAETLLIQLLRGSGVKGLAAMPAFTPFAKGHLVRPLLNFSRKELETYAHENQLQWVDDESNQNTGYDRNLLRHEIIPKLQTRWPSVNATLGRVASHCAESAYLLEQLAQQDMQTLFNQQRGTLSVSGLLQLNQARQRNIIRHWIHQQGFDLPNTEQLNQITSNVLHAKWDATPLVSWSDIELRRYRDELFVMEKLKPHDSTQVFEWDISNPLIISSLDLTLTKQDLLEQGVDPLSLESGKVTIRFRQGGEVIKLANQKHSKDLKKYFQEKGVPPWVRCRQPLIDINNALVCIII